MKIRKSLAGIAAGSLALAGVAVATAPAANAWTGTATSTCHLFFGSGLPGTPGSASISSSNSTFPITGISQSPINPNAGDTVTVTVTSSGVTNGPAQVSPGSLGVTGQAFVTGAQTTAVPLTIVGSYPILDVPVNDSTPGFENDGNIDPGTNMGPITMTGTYVASGNGAASIAYAQTFLNDSSPANADNYCDGTVFTPLTSAPASWSPKLAPAASSTAVQAFTITGPNASVTAVAQGSGLGTVSPSATGYARAGNTLTVAGTVWTASTAIDSVTVGGTAATNTLTVDAGGVLSGTITVPGAATTGLGSIVVTQGAKTSSTPITILGAATITLSPASAGPGTSIAVTGSNFNPSAASTLYACPNAPCIPGGPSINTVATGTGTVSATGTYSGSITATAGGTTIQAGQGSGVTALAGFATLTLNADTCTRQIGTATPTLCETKQNVSASVTAGALTQAATAYGAPGYTSTAIPMGSVTSSVTAQTLNGFLNPITVADARGGNTGWSLTAAMPTLTGAGTIANGNLAISGISCTANATGDPGVSATGNVAGSASTFAGTVTLCTKDTTADSAGDTSGGRYVVNANLALTVPAFQAAGAYTSTITVTLT